MKIWATSDTYPGNWVSELRSEFRGLEDCMAELAPDFPYSIGIVFRCLPASVCRKSFRRFDKKGKSLTLDLTVTVEQYRDMSITEQREDLGALFFAYFQESIEKYKENTSKEERAEVIGKAHEWLLAHGWLDGPAAKAKAMLADGADLYDVSELLGLPLEEVEGYYAAAARS